MFIFTNQLSLTKHTLKWVYILLLSNIENDIIKTPFYSLSAKDSKTKWWQHVLTVYIQLQQGMRKKRKCIRSDIIFHTIKCKRLWPCSVTASTRINMGSEKYAIIFWLIKRNMINSSLFFFIYSCRLFKELYYSSLSSNLRCLPFHRHKYVEVN